LPAIASVGCLDHDRAIASATSASSAPVAPYERIDRGAIAPLPAAGSLNVAEAVICEEKCNRRKQSSTSLNGLDRWDVAV
jgi:hypothetical protein